MRSKVTSSFSARLMLWMTPPSIWFLTASGFDDQSAIMRDGDALDVNHTGLAVDRHFVDARDIGVGVAAEQRDAAAIGDIAVSRLLRMRRPRSATCAFSAAAFSTRSPRAPRRVLQAELDRVHAGRGARVRP